MRIKNVIPFITALFLPGCSEYVQPQNGDISKVIISETKGGHWGNGGVYSIFLDGKACRDKHRIMEGSSGSGATFNVIANQDVTLNLIYMRDNTSCSMGFTFIPKSGVTYHIENGADDGKCYAWLAKENENKLRLVKSTEYENPRSRNLLPFEGCY